jgi:polyisoprenoid-binding protein YceI
MRRATKVIIGIATGVVVVGAAAVIAGPGIYANIVNGSAEAAPTLAPTGGATLSTQQAAGTWRSTDDSFAGYRVHEVLQGKNVNVVGRTDKVSAKVGVQGTMLSSATITVQVADIATPESARDQYFRSTALQTARFPTATFTLSKPVDVADALDGDATKVQLDGMLDLHGVTKPVSVDATVGVSAAGAVQVVGDVPVTFSDFGVQAPSLGFVTVDKSGKVEFSLDLQK